ncbi:MAG: glycoside hydrolase family 5 protein [Rhizobacter sp.]
MAYAVPHLFSRPVLRSLRPLHHLLLCTTVALLSACGGSDGPSVPASETLSTPTSSPITAPTASPATPSTTESAEASATGLRWRGVNLSGAEYNASVVPGRYGYQYSYPSAGTVDYFKSKGMNLIRLPFSWDRLQPTLNAALDATELQLLKDFVDSATAKGLTVLIDPHNYGRYRQQLIGSTAVPHSAFGDFWSRVAVQFRGNPKVIFGLMNEPHGMTTESWVTSANEAIRRIRSAGATNTIAVPGNAWSGAHSWYGNWYGTPNAQAMLQVVDSGNNLVFEVHQYLDADSSGTSPTCVSGTIGAQRLADFTAWLRTNRKRGLLGEFASADNATCRQALTGMLAHLKANSDVWAGWSYWVAGGWSSTDMFSVQPINGVDKPQMQLLLPYLN